jgi:hypothetical protein
MPASAERREHLLELIATETEPEDHYFQPSAEWVGDAEDEFEAAGFNAAEIPWGAIAVRAHELQEEFEGE